MENLQCNERRVLLEVIHESHQHIIVSLFTKIFHLVIKGEKFVKLPNLKGRAQHKQNYGNSITIHVV